MVMKRLLVGSAALLLPVVGWAQGSYPDRPIRLIVPFAPVGKIGDATLIVVAHPAFPGKTVRELIALSKADPKGISYGFRGSAERRTSPANS